MNDYFLILSCEHAGNKIPSKYKYTFANHSELLNSHKGYDPGAIEIAKYLSKKINATLYYSNISRLLIETNRSLHHKDLFSLISKKFRNNEKQAIIQNFYFPYRNKVEDKINEEYSLNKKVIHFSIHTFTPILNGIIRNADIGLLYNPISKFEKSLAQKLKSEIKLLSKDLNIRMNYPYKGKADGFTTYLRNKFGYNKYAGIEIEVNQKFYLGNNEWKYISNVLVDSITNLLNKNIYSDFT